MNNISSESKVNREQPPRLYLSPPHMGNKERELLLDAFDSNWVAPLGPHVDAFESEFAPISGRKHAVALASGTSALHLSLLLLGIEPGDEVFTSTLTFAATANAIRYVGANPVFIDSDRETWNLDPQLLKDELDRCAASNRLPAAIIVVDVNGQCADYESICELCQHYDVPIIEDAAEALGASLNNKPAGSFGEIACFSFNGNKIITTSGGGMLVTDRRDWADHARHLASQARDPAPHYEHSRVGYNYRLSNLLAAVGRGQLENLVDRVDRRRAIFSRYDQELGELPGINFMPEPDGFRSTRWITALTINPSQFGTDRESIRLRLEEDNIESRPVWKPMHLQPVFSECRAVNNGVSEELFQNGLCLPSGSAMTLDDQKRVFEIVKSCCGIKST